MKYIEIILNSGERIELTDDDNTSIDSYTKSLSEIFTSLNIAILTVKNKNTITNNIIRPSEVSMIKINEVIENYNNLESDDEVITD
jgi:hypothetical protein